MAKPTLYFTLVRCWHVGGFKVMRVTTEKRRQLYGSFLDEDMPTHCNPNQTVGRFETAEAAQAKVEGVKRIRERYAPHLKKIRAQEMRLEEDQRHDIDAYITGAPAQHSVMLKGPRPARVTDESGQSPGFGVA